MQILTQEITGEVILHPLGNAEPKPGWVVRDVENLPEGEGRLKWVGDALVRDTSGTLARLAAAIEAAVQSSIDALAKSWGYDSALSCASYAASTIPQFAAEAAALIAWRDSLWTTCYAAQESVDPDSALPTVEEFVSSLPTAPPRPTT